MNISLKVEQVYHHIKDKNILWDINLEIAEGQCVAIVGPSGSGKSTLFRSILGTHPPKGGKIYAGDKLITRPTRDVGIVYQQYTLCPFLTAKRNVAYGLKLDQTSIPYRIFNFWNWFKLREKHLEQSQEFLRKMNLTPAADKYPAELSGGMKQRVAIAQALIMKPKVLLLDEPFGALDEATRENMQTMILTLYDENIKAKEQGEKPPYTIVLVTHELNEAILVADRVIGLSQYWKSENDLSGLVCGSTIVYDKSCPVFEPHSSKDFNSFIEQKEELRRVVFNSDVFQDPRDYVTFWEEVKEGNGTGVMKF